MSYSDNFYTNNVDKVIDKICDKNTLFFKEEDFDREMEELKNEEMNRLYELTYIMKKDLKFLYHTFEAELDTLDEEDLAVIEDIKKRHDLNV